MAADRAVLASGFTQTSEEHVTTADGRFTVLMPHPERVFRNVQMSHLAAGDVGAPSPWMRMFHNARAWVG